VFAFGVMLAELLAGRSWEDVKSHGGIVAAVLNGRHPKDGATEVCFFPLSAVFSLPRCCTRRPKDGATSPSWLRGTEMMPRRMRTLGKPVHVQLVQVRPQLGLQVLTSSG